MHDDRAVVGALLERSAEGAHTGERQFAAFWPRLIFAAAVVLHAVMFVSLFNGYVNPLFDNTDHFLQGFDYFAVYDSGAAILRGDSVYSLAPVGDAPYASPYRYLPVMAYSAGVAFNALPPWTGYWLWVDLLELMLFADAWLTCRLARDRHWGLIAAATWFVFTPMYVEEFMGQWSFLMATLMLWTGAALAHDRPRLAGAPWIASVLEKTNSALFAPIFIKLRQWRLLAATAAAVIVLDAPYFLLHRADGRLFWDANFGWSFRGPVSRLTAMATGDLGGNAFIRSIWLTFDHTGRGAPRWLVGAVVLVVLAASLMATFLPKRPNVVALFAIWSAVFFLTYTQIWEQHYVMLLPALALLLALSPEHRALTVVVFVFVALPTPYWIFVKLYPLHGDVPFLASQEYAWPRWAGITYHASKIVPVFALWVRLCQCEIFRWRAEARAVRPPAHGYAPASGDAQALDVVLGDSE